MLVSNKTCIAVLVHSLVIEVLRLNLPGFSGECFSPHRSPMGPEKAALFGIKRL